MITRYKYFDDAEYSEVKPHLESVRRNASEGELEISHAHPRQYDQQIKLIRELLDEETDGLVLDLRLDIDSNEIDGEKQKANYRATTLAQEIRTLATEAKIKDVPVVLWSYDRRLKKSFRPDETGHDLFDLTCAKEGLEEAGDASVIAQKLVALASGYREIAGIKAENRDRKRYFYKFLGLTENPPSLDTQISGHFDERKGGVPVHEYARYIVKRLFEYQGPLIDEEHLAARVGVEKEDSPDWEDLKSYFSFAAYEGPFREGWPRWWAYRIENWWRELDQPSSLRTTEAKKRIEVLEEETDLERLSEAEPIEEDYSSRFWTVCQGYGSPLDPMDGFMARTQKAPEWADNRYLSAKAALNKIDRKKGLRVDEREEARFDRLKREKS